MQLLLTWYLNLYSDLINADKTAYQHGLSAVEQCFSLTTKQPQPAYKPQKQPTEQGELVPLLMCLTDAIC
jgi:hypothetical protein